MCKVIQARCCCEKYKINKNKKENTNSVETENWEQKIREEKRWLIYNRQAGGREWVRWPAQRERDREWQRHLMHDDSSRVIMTTTTTAMEQTTLQDPKSEEPRPDPGPGPGHKVWKLDARWRWSARRAAGRWKILDAFRMQMFAMPDKNDFHRSRWAQMSEGGRMEMERNCSYSAKYFTGKNFTLIYIMATRLEKNWTA